MKEMKEKEGVKERNSLSSVLTFPDLHFSPWVITKDYTVEWLFIEQYDPAY